MSPPDLLLVNPDTRRWEQCIRLGKKKCCRKQEVFLESPELCRWVSSLCEPPHLCGPGGALSFAWPGLCAWVKHLLWTCFLEWTGACGLGETQGSQAQQHRHGWQHPASGSVRGKPGSEGGCGVWVVRIER